MRAGVVEALVAGDRVAWLLVGVLWFLLAGLAVFHSERAGVLRTLSLCAITSAAGIVGLVLVTALSIPRIVWSASRPGDLVVEHGETWRRLRGPAVHIAVAGVPDVAMPTIDASGNWILVGILSGEPVPGLMPAPPAAPEVGAPRLCSSAANDRCRAWPQAWPDPSRAPVFDDLSWRKHAQGAIAYDVESGLFLGEPPESTERAHALELVGKVTNDAARSSAGAPLALDSSVRRRDPRSETTSLFVLRRVHDGRLDAVRVVARPTRGEGTAQTYALERASVALRPAPIMAAVAGRPLALLGALALPLAAALFFAAPALLSARIVRRGAVRHELDEPMSLAHARASCGEAGPATVVSPAVLGDLELERGGVVQAQLGADDGSPVASRTWWLIEGSSPESRVLIPADTAPFTRAARAWMARRLVTVALAAAAAASLAPVFVAVASWLSSR